MTPDRFLVLLARSLVGARVRFAHLVADTTGARVLTATDAGMVTLEGWSGEFAPHLFVVLEPMSPTSPTRRV